MSKYPLALAPNLLSIVRLLAGPAFLIWGSLPARDLVLVLLIAAAATDLVDGRLARALGASTKIGGAMDTTADKVFALCLALVLARADILPAWVFVVLFGQYIVLAIIGTAYSLRYHRIPVPDIFAHVAALVAVVAVIVGVASTATSLTTGLCIALIVANGVHLVTASLRFIGIRE